ncbi:glycoside hydrolase superfamily [Diaporthe sp. PMI_573]|nr:glycoside hydrolase superfamily [Diaporthaceae sp. PMI_573]
MYPRESLVVAALAAAPVLATPSSVNVYWGQQGNGELATACQDPSVDYITLGFVNISPENGGPTEYPGTNFGAHCWAEKYSVDGHTSELLTTCPSLTPGIAVCQGLGKKVLLSIGGVYSAYSNYTVSTPMNGVAFAEFVWGAFGPYAEDWAGKPRPFDNGDQHNAVDGFDFDLESSSAGDEGYAAMINTLRGLIAVSGRDDIITAAPQCPLDEWQTMTYLLENVQFDRLWIQFYNNPQCSLLQADGTPNPGFNYAAWEKYLANTPSKDAKLHIGLPGSADAAGSGYVDASVASTYLCQYGDYPMFGGVMVWDQWFAAQNTIDGASYNQVLYESMKCGCKACPVPTSTISTTASTTAASTSSSTAVTVTSSTTTSPTSTPTCTGVSGYDKDGTNIGKYFRSGTTDEGARD